MIEVFETEYMVFRLIERKSKTGVWEAINKHGGYKLGLLKWYGHWRQYCFFPELDDETVFSASCLRDIVTFIDKITLERKLKHLEARQV